jgi:hypothetical protein
MTALDREERPAEIYARLVRRVGDLATGEHNPAGTLGALGGELTGDERGCERVDRVDRGISRPRECRCLGRSSAFPPIRARRRALCVKPNAMVRGNGALLSAEVRSVANAIAGLTGAQLFEAVASDHVVPADGRVLLLPPNRSPPLPADGGRRTADGGRRTVSPSAQRASSPKDWLARGVVADGRTCHFSRIRTSASRGFRGSHRISPLATPTTTDASRCGYRSAVVSWLAPPA